MALTCILTLQLDEEAQAFFDQLRRAHFPPERNQIAAHLTLFHQLPASVVVAAAIDAAASLHSPFPLKVTGLRSLGRGVAYSLSSPILLDIHRQLAAALQDYLIPQDRQRFMPHVVIQNKVSAEQARDLLAMLQAGFQPRTISACGFDLWRYLGGPWEHLQNFPFRLSPL